MTERTQVDHVDDSVNHYGGPVSDPTDFVRVLDLEQIDPTLFRSTYLVPEDEYALYGGQVAAQALYAAGLTVGDDRRPHSLHCYFLRPGDARKPVVFQVDVDRDGRGFSARRVAAKQDGKVILSMSVSFHVGGQGPEIQDSEPPSTQRAVDSEPYVGRWSKVLDVRDPGQPHATTSWNSRLWARMLAPLPSDPLVQAAALTYVSDLTSGLLSSSDGSLVAGPSLDHSLWIHHPADLNDWVLIDSHPQVASNGRGTYDGAIYAPDGRLLASLVQEALYIPAPPSSS
ncbi:MAG: acyl-CoA thioesterase [Aeromicrobium sp.]|nr:acyl-CoA thioesterase [Aeromicrobium sp.]